LDRRRLSHKAGSGALSFLRNRWFQLVLRVALGAFFLWASLDKIANPAAFAKIVYQWQVLGPIASNLVAVLLPWIEALAGLLLIAGLWKRESAAVIAGLLVVFIGAAASVMARGIDVENCGCTSVAAGHKAEKSFFTGVGPFLILRNLAMLGGALMILGAAPREAARPAPE
jgi:putative oxidoreductase